MRFNDAEELINTLTEDVQVPVVSSSVLDDLGTLVRDTLGDFNMSDDSEDYFTFGDIEFDEFNLGFI